MKRVVKKHPCFECGKFDGEHAPDCTLAALGPASSQTEIDKTPVPKLNRRGLPAGKPTDKQRRLKGSINMSQEDQKDILKRADALVKLYERGDVDALLLKTVHFTAMNVEFMEWLLKHPPEGRSNTQALINGLNEARSQLIDLVAMSRERERVKEPVGSRKGTGRKRRQISSTRRA